MALRRSARRLIGTASRSTSACSPASKDIATPSSKLMPIIARATTRFRDATASPGHGFSFASDHKSVDILSLRNTLNRIVHIHPEPRGVSRVKTHKLVFRLFEGKGIGAGPCVSRSAEERILYVQVHISRHAGG